MEPSVSDGIGQIGVSATSRTLRTLREAFIPHAGAAIEQLRKCCIGKSPAPLATGRNAAFAAVQKTLAPGERVSRRDFRSIG